MAVMAKRRKKPKRAGVSFTVWLPIHVAKGLDWCQDQLPFNPRKRAIIIKALEAYLPTLGVDFESVVNYVTKKKPGDDDDE